MATRGLSAEARQGLAMIAPPFGYAVLMLAAPRGTSIRVTTRGPQAAPLAAALARLLSDRFGEGR